MRHNQEIDINKIVVLIGTGQIGQPIARRVSVGKQVLLADNRQKNLDVATKTLRNAGYEMGTTVLDVSSRDAVKSLAERAAGWAK
jgi:saccharopine dehydrogenase-like NADP-dependent oxidoreductase